MPRKSILRQRLNLVENTILELGVELHEIRALLKEETFRIDGYGAGTVMPGSIPTYEHATGRAFKFHDFGRRRGLAAAAAADRRAMETTATFAQGYRAAQKEYEAEIRLHAKRMCEECPLCES